jgi:hypothetical protein
MTVNGEDGPGTGKGNGDDKVVTFPSSAEERAALRKARQLQARQQLADVFLDESGGSRALFCTPDQIAYAVIHIDGHHETWPVRP